MNFCRKMILSNRTALRYYMNRHVLKFVLCLYVAVTLSACGQASLTGEEEVKTSHHFDPAVFELNRTKWLSSNVKNYSLNIDASGFVRPFLPAVIEVRESKLVSIKPVEPNKNKHWIDSYANLKLSTVDELFEFIESEWKHKPEVLDVVYDDKFGFPVYVVLDRSKELSDDELSVNVSNFRVK